jgi:phosphatidylglycerophosphate synthase
MIVAPVAAVATGWYGWVALAAAGSFGVLCKYRAPVRSSLPGGVGWADALTGARLAVLSLVAASIPGAPTAWVLAAFAFNVTVDALDGHVARRLREATAFGAVFDREVDAFFVLVAYLHFQLEGWLGAGALFAGILPFAYRLLASAAPIPVAAGHKERGAAPLAGLNFLLLLAAAAMPAYSPSILTVSVVVVCVSFSFSFRSLYRHAYPLP